MSESGGLLGVWDGFVGVLGKAWTGTVGAISYVANGVSNGFSRVLTGAPKEFPPPEKPEGVTETSQSSGNQPQATNAVYNPSQPIPTVANNYHAGGKSKGFMGDNSGLVVGVIAALVAALGVGGGFGWLLGGVALLGGALADGGNGMFGGLLGMNKKGSNQGSGIMVSSVNPQVTIVPQQGQGAQQETSASQSQPNPQTEQSQPQPQPQTTQLQGQQAAGHQQQQSQPQSQKEAQPNLGAVPPQAEITIANLPVTRTNVSVNPVFIINNDNNSITDSAKNSMEVRVNGQTGQVLTVTYPNENGEFRGNGTIPLNVASDNIRFKLSRQGSDNYIDTTDEQNIAVLARLRNAVSFSPSSSVNQNQDNYNELGVLPVQRFSFNATGNKAAQNDRII